LFEKILPGDKGRGQSLDKTKNITIIATVTALCLAGDSMLYITLPIYWQEAGLSSLWEVGILLSINRFIRLPLNPVAGWLYSKINLQTGLFIAVVLGTIANMGYALGQGFGAWLFFRSIWGAAWSLLSLGGLLTVIAVAEENNRGYLMGKYNGLYRLGSLVGMLFGGLLVSTIGFIHTALIFGFMSLFSIPVLLYLVKVNNFKGAFNISQNQVQAKFFQPGLFTFPVVRILFTGLVISIVIRGIINSTLSLVTDCNFPEEIILWGIIISSASLSGIIQAARWVWEPILASRFGKWSDGPYGRLPLFFLTLIIAAVSLSVIPLKIPLALWLIMTLILMLCATALTTLTDSLSSDVAKSSQTAISIMTLYTVANDLGAAIGPFGSYMVIDKLQYGLQLSYLGCSVLLIAIIFLWYKPYKERLNICKPM
jgi:predicted MFS family arabinose efflux permease